MAVWYVVRDGEFVSVIVRDEPDTFGMRQEALQYPDCRVWTHNHLGWCHMCAIGSNAEGMTWQRTCITSPEMVSTWMV